MGGIGEGVKGQHGQAENLTEWINKSLITDLLISNYHYGCHCC